MWPGWMPALETLHVVLQAGCRPAAAQSLQNRHPVTRYRLSTRAKCHCRRRYRPPRRYARVRTQERAHSTRAAHLHCRKLQIGRGMLHQLNQKEPLETLGWTSRPSHSPTNAPNSHAGLPLLTSHCARAAQGARATHLCRWATAIKVVQVVLS